MTSSEILDQAPAFQEPRHNIGPHRSQSFLHFRNNLHFNAGLLKISEGLLQTFSYEKQLLFFSTEEFDGLRIVVQDVTVDLASMPFFNDAGTYRTSLLVCDTSESCPR